MFLGDTHGDTTNIIRVVRRAEAQGVDRIVQLGDFGYWEHTRDGVRFLDAVDTALEGAGLDLWFVDGNHENHALLAERHWEDPWVRSRIRWLRRGDRFAAGGVQFVAAGGAGSIDAALRQPGDSWWPGEIITRGDVVRVTGPGPADVVLSHDAPEFAGHLDNLRLPVDWPLPEWVTHSMTESRWLLTQAVKKVQPSLVVHGHYHVERFTRCDWLDGDGWHRTNVLGLGMNYSTSDRQWLVVDVDDGRMVTAQGVRGLRSGSDLLGPGFAVSGLGPVSVDDPV